MTEGALTVAVVAGWISLWIFFGLLKAIRDLLAERTAAWLLPPAQPATFRAAQIMAFAARAIAPNRVAKLDLSRIFFAFFPVTWTARPWPDPDAAIAELEADLRCERRALAPFRLVLPLLRTALLMRSGNLWRLLIGIACLPLTVVAIPPSIFVATLMEEWDENDWLYDRRRRIRIRFNSIRRSAAARREKAAKASRL
jgi:hypothetical protein